MVGWMVVRFVQQMCVSCAIQAKGQAERGKADTTNEVIAARKVKKEAVEAEVQLKGNSKENMRI